MVSARPLNRDVRCLVKFRVRAAVTPMGLTLSGVFLASASFGSTPPQTPTALEIASCNLAAGASRYEGRLIKMRGRLDLGMHWFVLLDAACPDVIVFLKLTSDVYGADWCRSEQASERYGCPLKAGVTATVTGTYRYTHGSKQFHELEVTRFDDLVAGEAPNNALEQTRGQ